MTRTSKDGDLITNTSEETYAFIKSLGDVKAVLLTHHHEDHVECAYLFQLDGYSVYASIQSIKFLKDPPKIPNYRKIVWRQPQPVNAEPINDFLDNINISVFEASAPHSDDNVIYLIDDLLFTEGLIGSIKPRIAYHQDIYRKIMVSVRNVVLPLKFSKVYGGHLTLTKKDVVTFIEYLEDLRERIIEFRGQGFSIDKIIELLWVQIPEKVYIMEQISQGKWHRRYLVETLL